MALALALGLIGLFGGVFILALWLALLLNNEPNWGWALAVDILLFIIAFIAFGNLCG